MLRNEISGKLHKNIHNLPALWYIYHRLFDGLSSVVKSPKRMEPLGEGRRERWQKSRYQYFEGTPNSGMFYGQPDGVDAQGPGGAAGPAHDYGIPAGIHVGGAGISGAGSCPQKLSAGPPAAAALQRILGQSDLRRTARPELERLSDTLQETINLSMLLERDIFYLDKVETHRSIVCNTQVGSRAPAYATSARQGNSGLSE